MTQVGLRRDVQSSGKVYKLKFVAAGGTFKEAECLDNEYILDAAERAGIDLPATCRGEASEGRMPAMPAWVTRSMQNPLPWRGWGEPPPAVNEGLKTFIFRWNLRRMRGTGGQGHLRRQRHPGPRVHREGGGQWACT